MGNELNIVHIIMTILLCRVWIILWDAVMGGSEILFITRSPHIFNFKVHHYMYGVLLFIIGCIYEIDYIICFGIGLFLDEFYLLLYYGNNFGFKQYVSNKNHIYLAVIIVVLMIKLMK